jgi:hypothetical protein
MTPKVKMTPERKERQKRFADLARDVVEELQPPTQQTDLYDTLMTGSEEQLAEVAANYGLRQEELVFACDALIALRRAWDEVLIHVWGLFAPDATKTKPGK